MTVRRGFDQVENVIFIVKLKNEHVDLGRQKIEQKEMERWSCQDVC